MISEDFLLFPEVSSNTPWTLGLSTEDFGNPSKKNFRMPYTAVDSPRHPNDFEGSLTGLKEPLEIKKIFFQSCDNWVIECDK